MDKMKLPYAFREKKYTYKKDQDFSWLQTSQKKHWNLRDNGEMPSKFRGKIISNLEFCP